MNGWSHEPQESQRLRLYVMRHGESASGTGSVYYGHMDVALSARGMEQSQWLCRVVAAVPLVAVYTSDLRRTHYAAELIARAHRLPVISLPALREIHMGTWEGESIAQIATSYPELVTHLLTTPRTFQYPAGESFSAFGRRVQRTLQTIMTTHKCGDVAIVTHGGVCRLIIGHVLRLPPTHWLRLSQDFGCLNVIDWYDGLPLLRRLNQTSAELP